MLSARLTLQCGGQPLVPGPGRVLLGTRHSRRKDEPDKEPGPPCLSPFSQRLRTPWGETAVVVLGGEPLSCAEPPSTSAVLTLQAGGSASRRRLGQGSTS